MTTTLGRRFDDALLLAADVHRQQRRKGSDVPYVSHLLAVTATVLEAGGSEDEAIAALLHDSLEDHPDRVTVSLLTARFGSEVARIVVACSDTTGPDPDNKPPWRSRKAAFLERLGSADASVLLVALADKLHNATALRRELEAQGLVAYLPFNAGAAEQLWYFESLVDCFQARFPGPLTEDLAVTVSRIRSLSMV
jgi:(p)ppGpp synthase/HD superfamily hydrolase